MKIHHRIAVWLLVAMGSAAGVLAQQPEAERRVPQSLLLYLTSAFQTSEEDEATAAELDALNPDVIEQVMQFAVLRGHTAAAAVAAEMLGRKGTAEKLIYRGAKPTPLVRALRHPDRRLRMAALGAIFKLQPTKRFPGSSYVTQSLGFFAASSGKPRALVAGPGTEASRILGGWLAENGYEVDTATTGRELILLSVASPDYELALIDVSINRPPAELLLQRLRGDYRSADLRVGLIARGGQLERARRIAVADPLAMAFSRSNDAELSAWQIEQLGTLAALKFVDHAERRRQAVEALDLLAQLGVSSAGWYDLRSVQGSVLRALYVPELSTKAAAVLGGIGTPESQRALVELSSRRTQPIELRKAAVDAFCRNMKKHGILLTSDEIRRQYDRYNRSKDLDADTQKVLEKILDCIETPK